MKNTFRISFVAFFVFGALMVGCKSSTSPGSSNTVTVTRPGVGSEFIGHYQEFDTLGNPIASKDEYDTDVVIASGISYQGKTNVVKFRAGNSINPNSSVFYLNYETNGDISIYADNGASSGERSGWATIPIASKGSSSLLVYDSTVTLQNGTQKHETQTDEYTYTGEQNLTEAGTTFDAFAIKFDPLYQDGYKDFSTSMWWAPAIGFEIKSASTFTEPDANGAIRDQEDLVSYTLK